MKEITATDPNVKLCPDGKYRWCYEVNMLKNPMILFTVFKVLAISFAIVGALFFQLRHAMEI